MANYFDTLTKAQKENIAYLIKRMNEKGLTNKFTQAAILAVVSKESAFVPKSEITYRNTANDRIRAIFGDRLRSYSDSDLSKLKANDTAFYDAVYGAATSVGKKLGNTNPGDGYKYRGRGFNGITFKNLYQKYGSRIGVDLIANPDALNTVPVATDALIEYFKEVFEKAPKDRLQAYNTNGINGFTNINDAVSAMYHANAGWGKSLDRIAADPTGGRKKALSRSSGFYDMVNQFISAPISTAVEVAKKKPVLTIIAAATLTVAVYLLVTTLNKKGK